jgi:peptidoglycan/xylan/chitin deacetylase (PgdA/CDA1 family)
MEKRIETIIILKVIEVCMKPQIYLSHSTSTIDKNLIKLLNFYNLGYKILKNEGDIVSESCLFLNCDIFDDETSDDSFKEFLFSSFSNIFLYNVSPIHSKNIEWLTESKIIVSSINDDILYYKISDNYPEICMQLSGLTFQTNKINKDFIFHSTDSSIKYLVNINSKPYFICFENKGCKIFVIANKKMVDLSCKVTSEDFKISDHFSEFTPVLMFLKYVLKDYFWHPPNDYACFIIDDPLLKKKYGFLDYKELLSLMDKYNFCSNIAFIPYNYDRSDNEVASTFNERDDRFSISIHGCDHCEAEFGITDEKELNRKLKLALSRMNMHKNITKIDHNKVMVFPQGSFSSNSLKLLKANNYLGAINSNVLADDIPHIDISSFFSPASMNYYNFPLFLRRYPEDISDFALDLFMGKPIFFVEHHGFFKDDYKKLCKFVTSLNNNFPHIKWKSPQYILKNFFLERKDSDKSKCLKIFTRNTIIRNDTNNLISYSILKQEDDAIPIEKVLVNEKDVDYISWNNSINLNTVIQPKEQIEIKILYHNFFETSENPGVIATYKVFMRRVLTEVRDNYIEKNETLSRMAFKMKSLIKKFVA